MISLTSAVQALVYLLVVGLIASLCLWLVRRLRLPEPFARVADAVIAVAAVLICVAVLLSFVSGTPIFRP